MKKKKKTNTIDFCFPPHEREGARKAFKELRFFGIIIIIGIIAAIIKWIIF